MNGDTERHHVTLRVNRANALQGETPTTLVAAEFALAPGANRTFPDLLRVTDYDPTLHVRLTLRSADRSVNRTVASGAGTLELYISETRIIVAPAG